jgi:hypothetical protein
MKNLLLAWTFLHSQVMLRWAALHLGEALGSVNRSKGHEIEDGIGLNWESTELRGGGPLLMPTALRSWTELIVRNVMKSTLQSPKSYSSPR